MPNLDLDVTRLAEHVHGHLGWLAAAALMHPAIVLRHRKRRAHLAVGLSLFLVTGVGAMGASLYQAYRERLKQGIFMHAPRIGYLFERKEHLAFGAIALAWVGAIAYVAAARPATADETRAALRTVAFRAYAASAALALTAAVLGTLVAAYRSF